jgi:stalled ribosome rescue protein Dom34
LRPILTGQERPLIIAAAEPMMSVYLSVSTYAHTVSESLDGSADHTPDHVLAEQARDVLDGLYAAEIAALGELYATRENQGRATTDLAQAARAATYGAIDTLIVDIDRVVHGTVADEDGAITLAEEASASTYGVLDEIVSRALKSGAHIVAAREQDVPGKGALAAILRYAI